MILVLLLETIFLSQISILMRVEQKAVFLVMRDAKNLWMLSQVFIMNNPKVKPFLEMQNLLLYHKWKWWHPHQEKMIWLICFTCLSIWRRLICLGVTIYFACLAIHSKKHLEWSYKKSKNFLAKSWQKYIIYLKNSV